MYLKHDAVNAKSEFISRCAIKKSILESTSTLKVRGPWLYILCKDYYFNLCYTFISDRKSQLKPFRFIIIYSTYEMSWSIDLNYQYCYNTPKQKNKINEPTILFFSSDY